MAVTSLYSGENSIRNQRETSRNSLEKKYVFFTLGCLCFSAGLGIEFPGIYIYGNLGFVDFLILPIYVLVIKNKEKFSSVSFFPLAIGAVAFFSFSYHVLVSDYYMVGFDGYEKNDNRQDDMVDAINQYKKHSKSIELISLTPTNYPISKSSIYAPK